MRNLRNIYFFEHFAEIIPYIQEKKSKTSSIHRPNGQNSNFLKLRLLYRALFLTPPPTPPKSSVLFHEKRIKKSIFPQIAPLLSSSFFDFCAKIQFVFTQKMQKKKKVTFFLKIQPKKDMYLRRDRAHLIHRFLWYPKMKSQRPIVNPNRHEIKTQQFTFAFQC